MMNTQVSCLICRGTSQLYSSVEIKINFIHRFCGLYYSNPYLFKALVCFVPLQLLMVTGLQEFSPYWFGKSRQVLPQGLLGQSPLTIYPSHQVSDHSPWLESVTQTKLAIRGVRKQPVAFLRQKWQMAQSGNSHCARRTGTGQSCVENIVLGIGKTKQ